MQKVPGALECWSFFGFCKQLSPCGPKKLNSDVHSCIWTLEPCRLDCSSRKVKRSGYLLDFIFGRHAKLRQCFFPWGGITYDGKSLHTK